VFTKYGGMEVRRYFPSIGAKPVHATFPKKGIETSGSRDLGLVRDCLSLKSLPLSDQEIKILFLSYLLRLIKLMINNFSLTGPHKDQ
jgi:hypothetical protein